MNEVNVSDEVFEYISYEDFQAILSGKAITEADVEFKIL